MFITDVLQGQLYNERYGADQLTVMAKHAIAPGTWELKEALALFKARGMKRVE